MKNFLKIFIILIVLTIVILSSLLVLDVATATETIESMKKIILVLGIVGVGALIIGYVVSPKS